MPESVEYSESERERGEKVAGEVDALDPGGHEKEDGGGGRDDGGEKTANAVMRKYLKTSPPVH